MPVTNVYTFVNTFDKEQKGVPAGFEPASPP